LYSSFGQDEPETQKKEKKKRLITGIVLGVNKLHLHKKRNFFKYSLQAFSEGNAFFMSFDRYDSEYSVFEEEFKKQYHSDLKKYLESLKEKYPSL
jgi:hypothetical protein